MNTNETIYRDFNGNVIDLDALPEWKREGILREEREIAARAARKAAAVKRAARRSTKAGGDWGFIAAINGVK